MTLKIHGENQIHNDNYHSGSAKRNTALGLAGLNVDGDVLVPGSRIYLTRNVGEYITIKEDTSNESVLDFKRNGAADYEARIKTGSNWEVVQNESHKGIVNGICSLDSEGFVEGIIRTNKLTVAEFQTNAGTGTATLPDRLNNGGSIQAVEYDVVNEYVEVLFPRPAVMTEYRQYGNNLNNGTGRFTLQFLWDGNWYNNTTAIAIHTVFGWSGWSTLTTPLVCEGIRLVCTTVDTAFNKTFIQELELRG